MKKKHNVWEMRKESRKTYIFLQYHRVWKREWDGGKKKLFLEWFPRLMTMRWWARGKISSSKTCDKVITPAAHVSSLSLTHICRFLFSLSVHTTFFWHHQIDIDSQCDLSCISSAKWDTLELIKRSTHKTSARDCSNTRCVDFFSSLLSLDFPHFFSAAHIYCVCNVYTHSRRCRHRHLFCILFIFFLK